MFLIHRPTQHEIAAFLDSSRDLPLSYDRVGLARDAGRGFRLDELTTVVGRGQAAFTRAGDALRDWRHFDLGWLGVFPPRASIEPGTVVAVCIRHVGFWSLNGCRVVYAIGAFDAPEFGFAYGTLSNHAEAGEEIFKVSFDAASGDVAYTVRAASRPRAALARLGYPFTRALQARFRRDSARAIERCVRSAAL